MYGYNDHDDYADRGERLRHDRRYDRRKLSTDRTRGWLVGVCAGIGRHFDIDPVIVRIGVVVMALWAPGFTAGGYAVAWLLMARG